MKRVVGRKRAAKPAAADLGRQGGTVAAIMGWFFLRHLRALYQEFGGDLIMPIVLGEIAHHNICRYYSCGRPSAASLEAAVKEAGFWAGMPSCNAFSLSCATGIPRETVRRKAAALVKRGWIKRDAKGGYRLQPCVAEHFDAGFTGRALDDLFATCDDIRTLLHRGASGAMEKARGAGHP